MLFYNHLRTFLALWCVALLLPTQPVQARTRKGDKFYKQGQAAEARKDYDQALEFYNQALKEDPTDPGYLIGVRRVRFQLGEVHVEAGMKLRQAGKLNDALVEYQKAYAADPASAIAIQEIKRTSDAIEEQKK